ncbi:MAG: alpha/beta hydrolase [Chthoniobacteraceae bacterium]
MKTLLALAFATLASLCRAAEPQVIPLWPERPPQFLADAPAETFENGTFHGVTIPTITLFAPPAEKRNGMAILVCAGGGYGGLAWTIHVEYAAQVFNPMGVTVIGLKYRLRPPHKLDNAGIQALTLLDAKRAVRLVRHRAGEWGIDPRKIGVAGYSAGANLAMNLAANFDEGDPHSPDAIERVSSRPDFAVGLGTWHWRKPENPFVFKKNAPPVYLVHAITDKPVEIATNIVADLKKLGVPARLDMFEEGGHGVGNLIPTRVQHGFHGAQWPKLLLDWLKNLPSPP